MHIPTFIFIFILFRTNILLFLLYPTHVIKPLGYNLGCYRMPLKQCMSPSAQPQIGGSWYGPWSNISLGLLSFLKTSISVSFELSLTAISDFLVYLDSN